MEVVTRQSIDVLAVEDPNVADALCHIRKHAVEVLANLAGTYPNQNGLDPKSNLRPANTGCPARLPPASASASSPSPAS
jgi:hypothetical protein